MHDQKDQANRRKAQYWGNSANLGNNRAQFNMGADSQAHVPNDIRNEDEDQQQQQQQKKSDPESQRPTSSKLGEHQLSQFVRNKQNVYTALTVKGQFHLMPLKLCSFSFLKDVLSKKKLVFHTSEVVRPILPSYARISCAQLIEACKKVPKVLKYLPDPEELEPKRVNQEWLASIVNTLDPSYFKEYIQLAELRRRRQVTPEDNIEIDNSMLQVLKQFVDVGRSKDKRTSIQMLKINSKKRKRPTSSSKPPQHPRGIRVKTE